VKVERHELEGARWERIVQAPHPSLQPWLGRFHEGWTTESRLEGGVMREVPYPGIPVILNLGDEWRIADGASGGVAERRDSFVAGMHIRPALVHSPARSSCIELRLSPLGAHRILGLRMEELKNRTVDLEDLLGRQGRELTARLRDTAGWAERFDLVDAFLIRRLADARQPADGVAWAWRRLADSGGRLPVGTLAAELGWSPRRLIARFREHVGLTPKGAARVIRFDRAVARLRADAELSLADVAYECGYFDQAHFNRDFRELAGTTPTSFLAATSPVGSVAA
jgi:AraC-like DNA-binding protein